jgi:GAF domain-containing protein
MARDLPSDWSGFDQALHPAGHATAIPVDITLRTSRRINLLLGKLVIKLRRYFAIEKTLLAFYDPASDHLRVTHLLADGALRSSLTLTIPNHASLLYQVLLQGYPVADNYPDLVTGNIIEKKLLLCPSAKSLLVIPLVHNGCRLGLLSLASSKECDFGLYLEGAGERFVADFVRRLVPLVTPPDTVTES